MAERVPSDPQEAPRRDDLIAVAQVKGPWGLRGDVKVDVATDFPQRLSPGSRVFLDNLPTQIQKTRRYQGGLIVKLEGIDNRSDAEEIRGKSLQVHQDTVAPLPEGYYYHFQIIDMQVWTDQGELLGTIREILSTGSNDVYVVRGDGKETLVPALDDVILEVDAEQGRMTVSLPEGLR